MIKKFTNNAFPTEKDFLEQVKKARVIHFSKDEDALIQNRSRTKNKKELLDLIKTYRSYPIYRNETTLENLYDRFRKNGKNIIFSGNTRLDIAFQLGKPVKGLLDDAN